MPFLILAFIIISFPASAWSQADQDFSPPLLMSTVSKILPRSQIQGLSDYLSVIGVEVTSLENVGFRNFNNKQRKRACLDNLAAEFYADIDRDEQVLKPVTETSWRSPNLTQVSGGNFPAGWLWKKALKFSDGNSLLAMQLIGLCGHDDKRQIEAGKNFELSKNSTRMPWKDIPCQLSSSSFYNPGSLGAETIIPLDLRKKIAQVQAPTKGMESLPAKYYHTMGAAYSSCFMVRRDVPDWITSRAVKGSINAYRAQRICQDIVKDGEDGLLKQSVDSILNSKCSTDAEKIQLGCKLKKQAGMIAVSNSEMKLKKFRRYLASVRAAQLFRRSSSYLGAKRCDGYQLNKTVRRFFEQNGSLGKSNPCPSSMPKQDCADIRNVMATWAVDFERDEAQHMAGLAFARKHCPKIGIDQDPLANTCSALKAALKIPPVATKSEAKSKKPGAVR